MKLETLSNQEAVQETTVDLKTFLNIVDPSLTVEERVNIARQCIQLVCVLYEDPLSHEHYPIRPEHFYVTLISHDEASLESIKVSLKVSVAPIIVDEKAVLEDSLYTPPELRMEAYHDKPSSLGADIYRLGVILNGYSNKTLLSDKAPNVEYKKFRRLAKSMRSLRPEDRPTLQTLKEACGLSPVSQSALSIIMRNTQHFLSSLIHNTATESPALHVLPPQRSSIEQLLQITARSSNASDDELDKPIMPVAVKKSAHTTAASAFGKRAILPNEENKDEGEGIIHPPFA